MCLRPPSHPPTHLPHPPPPRCAHARLDAGTGPQLPCLVNAGISGALPVCRALVWIYSRIGLLPPIQGPGRDSRHPRFPERETEVPRGQATYPRSPRWCQGSGTGRRGLRGPKSSHTPIVHRGCIFSLTAQLAGARPPPPPLHPQSQGFHEIASRAQPSPLLPAPTAPPGPPARAQAPVLGNSLRRHPQLRALGSSAGAAAGAGPALGGPPLVHPQPATQVVSSWALGENSCPGGCRQRERLCARLQFTRPVPVCASGLEACSCWGGVLGTLRGPGEVPALMWQQPAQGHAALCFLGRGQPGGLGFRGPSWGAQQPRAGAPLLRRARSLGQLPACR